MRSSLRSPILPTVFLFMWRLSLVLIRNSTHPCDPNDELRPSVQLTPLLGLFFMSFIEFLAIFAALFLLGEYLSPQLIFGAHERMSLRNLFANALRVSDQFSDSVSARYDRSSSAILERLFEGVEERETEGLLVRICLLTDEPK